MQISPKFYTVAASLIIFLSIFTEAATALPSVTCFGLYHNQTTGDAIHQKLMKVNYDPYYYEVELLHYTVGADYSYLPNGGIGLIIYDNKSHRSTDVTSGFRKIGNTNVYESNLKLYDKWPNENSVVITVQCSYSAP